MTQFWFDRQITPVIYGWPVQDNSSKTLYTRTWLLQSDVGDLFNQIDAPNRWIDAICANAAARIAVKWAPDRLSVLKPEAEAAFNAAAAEDVENVPLRIVPNMFGGRWT